MALRFCQLSLMRLHITNSWPHSLPPTFLWSFHSAPESSFHYVVHASSMQLQHALRRDLSSSAIDETSKARTEFPSGESVVGFRRDSFFPRRAVMYVPASDERKVKKVMSIDVDSIVFDLEDGVAMNQKEVARSSVSSAVSLRRASGCGPHQELVVRVNGVDSGMMAQDLAAVLGGSGQEVGVPSSRPDAIMLPKCDSVEHLRQLDLALAAHSSQLSRSPPLVLYTIIESPRALVDLKEILSYGVACARRYFTFGAVVFGSDDFLAAIGGTRMLDARELMFARQSIVTHAKAFNLDAIDLVDINYKDLDSLKKQSEEAACMGFTGKQVIHPDQVLVVQAAFSPTAQQVEWAKGLIVAFHDQQESGQGAFEYMGASIDKPLLLQAENIVKLQEQIQ